MEAAAAIGQDRSRRSTLQRRDARPHGLTRCSEFNGSSAAGEWNWGVPVVLKESTAARTVIRRVDVRRAARQNGVFALEFGLTLVVVLPLFLVVGEFYRLSLWDQALAGATHTAAMTAGRNPGNCQQAAQQAFEEHDLARWLFDQDGDGTIGFVAGQPDGSTSGEVFLVIDADDGNVANGVDFDQRLCGSGGSWIRVTASVSLRAFGIGTIQRRHQSWATNQE